MSCASLLARERGPGRRRLIVSDSLFSMDGDRAPVPELADLAREHGALLRRRRGARRRASIDDATPVDLRIGTLGKALGGFGAYVAASAPLVDLLAQRARSFVFTTALPVPVVAAAHAAIDWLDDRRRPRPRRSSRRELLATSTRAAVCRERLRTSCRCVFATAIRAARWPRAKRCSSAASSPRESARRRCRPGPRGCASR